VNGKNRFPDHPVFGVQRLRLSRIDWRRDVQHFSVWATQSGITFPARCVGFKNASGKPWCASIAAEIRRIDELPKGPSDVTGPRDGINKERIRA
jgi:hypothetical protein